MELVFLGTGAADFNIDERQEGELFRRLTTAQINEDLLIDCSPHVSDYLEKNNADISTVAHILLTHLHSDHYAPQQLQSLFKKEVCLWTEPQTHCQLARELPHFAKGVLKPFEKTQVGDYEVIAVPANHAVTDKTQVPLHYIISKDNQRLFWGCDGSWLLTDTWLEIKKYQYDVMVLDGTLGNAEGDYRIFEHNNLRMIKEMVATIKALHILKPGGQIIISHLSKYAHKTHDALQKEMEAYGVLVAYDGFKINF
jgi:phosphoribosyl 1,2-cyclic phosphate phosphodiesterase